MVWNSFHACFLFKFLASLALNFLREISCNIFARKNFSRELVQSVKRTHGEKSSLEFKIWLFYFLEFIEKYIYNTIGYLELQKVHKQYKVEVDELKKKLCMLTLFYWFKCLDQIKLTVHLTRKTPLPLTAVYKTE